jgi:hypothetical protein
MYKECLQAFDGVYLSSTLESRSKANNLGIPNVPLVAAMVTGALTQGAPPPGGPNSAVHARARLQAQQIGQLVPFAYQSVAELRARNVPDPMIQVVEANRTLLQRAYDDQSSFTGRFRPQQQPGMGNGLPQAGMHQMHPEQQQNGSPADPHQGNGMGPSGGQPSFGPVAGGQMPDRRMMQMNAALSQGGMPNPGMNMDGRQGPFGQVPPAPLPHQMPQGGPASGLNTNHEQLQIAMAYISRVKTEFLNSSKLFFSQRSAKLTDHCSQGLPNMPTREVPPEQRAQFNTTLEQLHRLVTDNDSKLPMFFMLLSNSELIKRLVMIVRQPSSLVRIPLIFCKELHGHSPKTAPFWRQ